MTFDLDGRASRSLFAALLPHLPQTARRLQADVPNRLFDLLIVILLAPLLLALVPIVKLLQRESPGPLFFVQDRIGRDGQPFQMVKFRTMHVTAKSGVFACENETHVFSGGAFLRQFHLDELPQIWNVARGDMSIVGPRPEQVGLVARYAELFPHYAVRHCIKPGLTGLSQVRLGYAASDAQTRTKLDYDLFYIRKKNLLLDLKILIWTVRIMLR